MARTAATVQELSVNGKNLTLTAWPASGTNFGITINQTDGRVILIIDNDTTQAPTITVVAGAAAVIDGFVLTSQTYSVPATPGASGTTYTIWLDPKLYADSGIFSIDSSLSAGIYYAVAHLPSSFS